MGVEDRRYADGGDDGHVAFPRGSDSPVQGAGRDRARVAVLEEHVAAAAGLSLDGAPDPGAYLRLCARLASRTLDAAEDERPLFGAQSDSLPAENQSRRDRSWGEDHPRGVAILTGAGSVARNAGRSAAPVVDLSGKTGL